MQRRWTSNPLPPLRVAPCHCPPFLLHDRVIEALTVGAPRVPVCGPGLGHYFINQAVSLQPDFSSPDPKLPGQISWDAQTSDRSPSLHHRGLQADEGRGWALGECHPPSLWTRDGERGAGEVQGRRRGLSLTGHYKHAHGWGGRECGHSLSKLQLVGGRRPRALPGAAED